MVGYSGKAPALQSGRLWDQILAMAPIAVPPWAGDIASLSLSFLFVIALCITSIYFIELLKELPEMVYEG